MYYWASLSIWIQASALNIAKKNQQKKALLFFHEYQNWAVEAQQEGRTSL